MKTAEKLLCCYLTNKVLAFAHYPVSVVITCSVSLLLLSSLVLLLICLLCIHHSRASVGMCVYICFRRLSDFVRMYNMSIYDFYMCVCVCVCVCVRKSMHVACLLTSLSPQAYGETTTHTLSDIQFEMQCVCARVRVCVCVCLHALM